MSSTALMNVVCLVTVFPFLGKSLDTEGAKSRG